MFGLNILDTTIGLVFVYLMLSLVCTALNEWIASMLSRRAKTLYEGLKTLLWDPKKPSLLADFYAHPLVQDLGTACSSRQPRILIAAKKRRVYRIADPQAPASTVYGRHPGSHHRDTRIRRLPPKLANELITVVDTAIV